MFSYRHAYHAGNHADVLKHATLIGVLRHLTDKPVPLMVVDTHAGAGLYRLDSDAAHTSGEMLEGVQRLRERLDALTCPPSPLLADYLSVLDHFQKAAGETAYPGSPFISKHLLRDEDKLKLFELHPTDARLLEQHVKQLNAHRQVAVLREDGFEHSKKFLPPPSRRGLVLMDPSYELKTDYARVIDTLKDHLKRFATGTYMIWFPVIARPESQDLPRRLKNVAQQAGKDWLLATMRVRSGQAPRAAATVPGQSQARPGLVASGVFLVNPPYTLKTALKDTLPQMVEALGQDKQSGFSLEHN
ncbi:MAG: 23S rRNA (adenine(2030)-N(6))-methyltransferase RlmJ [Alphaproteobacteria bacterium]|nr:23S rRNA (adenine(2030)-N(6))-methyltransferase RlmJ [Alphaproteobacteria bacterium]